MKSYSTSLFIFRRDLRIDDNTALNTALAQSAQVIPCFIFNPEQIEPHPYQSKPGLNFMLASLRDLQQQFSVYGVQLNLFYGTMASILDAVHAQYNIEAVFVNRDYTPFSRNRDYQLQQQCAQLGIDVYCLPDTLLNEPEAICTHSGEPYKVFTPFYNRASANPVALPQAFHEQHFLKECSAVEQQQITELFDSMASSENYGGGRKQALDILNNLSSYQDYQMIRDFPAQQGTTQLSAHLKFGTCSVREVFYAIQTQLGPNHPLLRQLYWRDFFTHIAFHYPKVFGHAFNEQYDKLPWQNNKDRFERWSQGMTGFPIVDAGMRELNQTGFMHNRVRMITASFLVKDLHISWRWGERYFAQHLTDYDPCLNNGNWQWAASTGCDAQPYFRIFNPWLQQEKFDPDCEYIYRWIPELRTFPPKLIHQWDKKYIEGAYPKPMLDHKFESEQTKGVFKKASTLNRN